MAYGTSRGVSIPQFGTGMPQPESPAARAGRLQIQADYQGEQDQRYRQGVQESETKARRTAEDQLFKLTNTPGSYVETNGSQINANTGGGGGMSASGRASGGGVAIGGGVFPDISAQMAQFNQNVPKVQAPANVPQPGVPSSSGAFAHAKDVSGRVGSKALEALRNEMSRRGVSDSGMATAGEANILGNMARGQADAEYQAANTDTARQWEANQLGYQGNLAQNEMGYQGGIQQRGQDMTAFLNLLRQLY